MDADSLKCNMQERPLPSICCVAFRSSLLGVTMGAAFAYEISAKVNKRSAVLKRNMADDKIDLSYS